MSPGPNGEPSDGDWLNLAGEFGNMASASLLAAFVSSGLPTQLAAVNGVPTLQFVAPAASLTAPNFAVAGGATFFCCGGSTTKDVTVTTTLTQQSPQLFAVVARFSDATLGWIVGSGSTAKTIQLTTSGVNVSGSLASSAAGVLNGTQQLTISGAVSYKLTNGDQKSSTLNATLSYTTYPAGSPTGGGQMGPSTITGTINAPPANRCTKVPREGCPPCTTGGCGPAPCGIWPACPAS